MSVYALNKVDGVYQIATADDLFAFAELVNGGETSANAVLVADIDKGTENYRIGRNGQDYQGIFDGNGHTITYNMTFDEDGAALFRNVGAQAVIKNLKVQGTINTNSSFAGSIAGWNSGRIVGCYADVTINSSKEGGANHGGLVGRGYLGTVIENCLVKVAIKGEKSQNCGGVIGWTSDKINIVNTLVVSKGSTLDFSSGTCCNIACCPSINNASNVVTKNVYVVNPISNGYGRDGDKYIFYENEEGIANGELAFLLNGKQSGLNRFYQVIGTDPMPTPLLNEGGRIFVTAPEFRCDGLPIGNTTFSNTYTSDPVIPDHHFVDGWCTVCGQMDENFMTPVDGWLNISNGAQLKWWSVYAFTHEDCKARLTADINMEGYCEGYTPPQIFVGEFDGHGHVISNFVIDTYQDYQGFIGIIGNGAVIKNFILDSTCSITGSNWCGVIGGTNGSGDIYIDRVGNEGTVITFNSYAGGILGVDMQGVMNLHITNCYVTGTIDGGRESAAICGYSNANSEVINCWSTATIPQYSIYSSDSFTRGPAKVTNCYEADIEGVDANKQQHINPNAEDYRVNFITLEEVANGALCYKLNESKQGGENFYQVIGTDPIPLPFAKEGGKVYSHGNSVYANTPPVKLEGTWTDSNGTEWYFTTNGSNATISSRGWDDVNSRSIPSISGTIPEELTIPATVYIGAMPYSVTSIGDDAFWYCSNLTSVTIPESVTSIGGWAFECCSNLTSINIPDGITSIGNCAFEGCSSLISINIPDGVTSIGNSTFYHCYSLKSITIPEGVTSIGKEAFYACRSLITINIPEGVTSIGTSAFDGCSSLTSIIIPEGVTSISINSFQNCSCLASITIPKGVTSIGDYSFNGCNGLTSIIVGMQTPIDLSMNTFTFGNQEAVTLYVPIGSKTAYQSADVWKDFKEIMEYNYVDGSQDPPVSEYNAALAAITDGSYYLTTEVNGTKYYVTQDGYLTNDEGSAYAFAISKVDASGAVSQLFDVAFLIDPENGAHFSNPTPLLDGKAYLHLGFFYQDDHNNRNDWDRQVLFLNETGKFAIRSSNTPYGETSWLDAGRTFWTWEVGTDNSIIPCYSYEPAYIWTLEEAGAKEGFWTDANGTEWYFTISGSKATISNRGWDNSGHIPSISGTIPNELTIPSTVYIGETPYLVNAIGDCAFYNCSCLTSITIPEEVTSIGWSAFYGCSSLTSITIPESVTSIARGAFFYCSGLTSITIPKSVTFIKGDLFTGCDNLTSITVEEGNSVYDSRNGCNAIIKTASNILISGCRNTIIPESVVSIGESAFQSRYILTSITIPDGVASIGDYAFNCCADLTSITIPNSVKTIGSGAFRICDNLTSIVVNEGNTVYDSRNGCNAIIESASNTLISGCKNTIIPDGVTSIGSEAFYCCYSLTSINIPESVTSIGESSFVGCISLSSITIPESVTVIGERSFAGCSKLNTVTVNAVTPPACADDAFSNIADNCTLKVPYGTGDAYAAADGWKNFNEIIECDPEGTDISQLDNAIYIEPFVAKVGENAQMVICLKNAEAATAYVFDLVLPEGITVANNDKGKYIDELSDRHDDHTRTFNYKGNNTYSLSTLSGNSEQLTGNDGPIRLVTIEASDNMVEGNYAIEIKNASYSKPDGTLVSLPDTRAVVTVEDYVLGDVNGNGGVDIGDAVSIVNYLVGKDSSIFVAKAADTNKNGQIDIGDAVTIVNLLVGKITNFTREFNIIWDEKEPE